MERRLAVHARAHRHALSALAAAAVLLGSVAPAVAVPKTKAAKAAFDRGVAAYRKKDYTAASVALAKSFALELDLETLFAWAQAERQLGRCDKASELYGKLLAADLPAANKAAIRDKLDECRAILAAMGRAAKVAPKAASKAAPDPRPEPVPTASPMPRPDPSPDPDPAARVGAPIVVVRPPPAHRPRAWWNNPIGLGLAGAGAIGLATGAVFLHQASTADDAKAKDTAFDQFSADADRAHSRGQLGLVATSAGAVLLVGGLVWMATHREREQPPVLSGWLAPTGGGLAVSGGF